LNTSGTDIDPDMIERAKKNLEYFHVNAKLAVQDALKNDELSEAIVTDLPYGRNSKADNLRPLFTTFLTHAQQQTKMMVVAFPDIFSPKQIIEEAGWQIKAQYTWPLHKTLNKELYVLEK